MRARILIIEDNDMSFVLADYLLRQQGYSTTRASDGRAGVQAALGNAADLILCDLDLPLMDGYEIVGALRANTAWHPVPVLAFTGDSHGKDHTSVLAAGFTAYVFKPPDPRTFVATIAQYIAPEKSAG
jgi:two-component system cell cycle response regulator DivK